MNDTGCLGQMDKAVAAAIELYVTDGKKLEDGTSFVTELNNCMLTISLKDKSLSYFNGSEMVVVRPPKGMIGADYRRRREYSLREWIKYQKYLDTKGKWRG